MSEPVKMVYLSIWCALDWDRDCDGTTVDDQGQQRPCDCGCHKPRRKREEQTDDRSRTD